jgi:uncharacterized coiled-coil protein SlyX
MSLSFENVEYDLNSLFSLQYTFDTLKTLIRSLTDSQKASQEKIKDLERRVGERDTVIKEMNKEILNMSKNFEKRVNVIEVNIKKVKDTTDNLQNDQNDLVNNVATLAEKTNNLGAIKINQSGKNLNNLLNNKDNGNNNTQSGHNTQSGFVPNKTQGKDSNGEVTEKDVTEGEAITDNKHLTDGGEDIDKLIDEQHEEHAPFSLEYKVNMDKFEFDIDADPKTNRVDTQGSGKEKLKGDDLKYIMSLIGGDGEEGFKKIIVYNNLFRNAYQDLSKM